MLDTHLGWPALINQPHDFPQAYTAVRNHSVNVFSSTQVPPQLAAGASHSNCSSHAHAPHATENLFSIDQLFYGTHSRMTYNHSRIVNHFAMLLRTTTNHINLPQQKTFTYHSPLPFLNLHSRNYFLTTSRWRPPRSGFFPVGESLNIINSIQCLTLGQWLPAVTAPFLCISCVSHSQ